MTSSFEASALWACLSSWCLGMVSTIDRGLCLFQQLCSRSLGHENSSSSSGT